MNCESWPVAAFAAFFTASMRAVELLILDLKGVFGPAVVVMMVEKGCLLYGVELNESQCCGEGDCLHCSYVMSCHVMSTRT